MGFFNLALGRITKVWNDSAIVDDETVSKQHNTEESTSVLQRLNGEEANLMEVKQNLISLREKQLLKLQKNVKSKNEIINKLRTEITDLKIECEKLSISVRASRCLLKPGRASKKAFRQTLKNRGYSEKAINEIWKWYDYSANYPERK
jgi:hypothetical protein